MDLKTDVLTIITDHPYGLTIPELLERLDEAGRIDTRGECCLELAPNLILWGGMGEEMAAVIAELRAERRFHLHPVTGQVGRAVFAATGSWLKLPVAHKPPLGGYRSLHWLPAYLHPEAKCTEPQCPEQ